MLLVHCPRLVVRASRDILLNFLRLLSRVGGPAGMVTTFFSFFATCRVCPGKIYDAEWYDVF